MELSKVTDVILDNWTQPAERAAMLAAVETAKMLAAGKDITAEEFQKQFGTWVVREWNKE